MIVTPRGPLNEPSTTYELIRAEFTRGARNHHVKLNFCNIFKSCTKLSMDGDPSMKDF